MPQSLNSSKGTNREDNINWCPGRPGGWLGRKRLARLHQESDELQRFHVHGSLCSLLDFRKHRAFSGHEGIRRGRRRSRSLLPDLPGTGHHQARQSVLRPADMVLRFLSHERRAFRARRDAAAERSQTDGRNHRAFRFFMGIRTQGNRGRLGRFRACPIRLRPRGDRDHPRTGSIRKAAAAAHDVPRTSGQHLRGPERRRLAGSGPFGSLWHSRTGFHNFRRRRGCNAVDGSFFPP